MVKYMFIALTLFLNSNTYANGDPFLYRHDVVIPDDVFKIGFIVNGNNTNMYQHIRGTSCFEGDQTSGLISTSASEAMTHIMAEQNTPVGMVYYLYTIRPTSNFYNSIISLRAAYWRTNDQRFLDTINEYGHEEEWLAVEGVHPHQVHSAREYRSNGPGQQATYIRTHDNPLYRDEDTFRNNSAYFIPAIPPDDLSDRTACSICQAESLHSASKRDIYSGMKQWLSCRKKIYLSVFYE